MSILFGDYTQEWIFFLIGKVTQPADKRFSFIFPHHLQVHLPVPQLSRNVA